jgi:type I restriction enzyme S subunit
VPYHEHFTKPPQAATLKGFKIVKAGQVVVNRMQAGFGLIFASRYDGLVSPDFGVFSPTGEVEPEFLGEIFRSRDIRAQFQRESKGLGTGKSGFMRLYDDRIGIVAVAYPPSRDEQHRILGRLHESLVSIDKAIQITRKEISALIEYGQTLRSNVVTGKLDVREAVARLPAADLEGDKLLDDTDTAADREEDEDSLAESDAEEGDGA